MNNQDPLLIAVSIGVAAYLTKLLVDDIRAWAVGTPNAQALPGATLCPPWLIAVGAALGVLLCGVAIVGENALGVAGEQSTVTVFFLGAMIGAAVIEEVIFRGWVVVSNCGAAWLHGSIFAASFLFALLHFHWLNWGTPETPGMTLQLTPAALWFTGTLFLNSVVWYYLRFNGANRARSLLPCIASHLAYNLAVFVSKAATGHVGGLW